MNKRPVQHSSKRGSRGQALVEFSLVIPIFMTAVVAVFEFSFLFSSYVSIQFASHDASQLAATYGNTAGADCAILERIGNDIMAPANPNLITTVDIFWVNTAAGPAVPVAGAEQIYTYDGLAHNCQKPDGSTITVRFPIPNTLAVEATTGAYPEVKRCNVNQGIGCAAGHNTIDTVGVKITYQYNWVTPLPTLIAGSPVGPLLTATNVMRLEPVL